MISQFTISQAQEILNNTLFTKQTNSIQMMLLIPHGKRSCLKVLCKHRCRAPVDSPESSTQLLISLQVTRCCQDRISNFLCMLLNNKAVLNQTAMSRHTLNIWIFFQSHQLSGSSITSSIPINTCTFLDTIKIFKPQESILTS